MCPKENSLELPSLFLPTIFFQSGVESSFRISVFGKKKCCKHSQEIRNIYGMAALDVSTVRK